jgi:hypothetical protein
VIKEEKQFILKEIKVLPIFEVAGNWIKDLSKDFNFENEGAVESTDEIILIILDMWLETLQRLLRKDDLPSSKVNDELQKQDFAFSSKDIGMSGA